MDVLVKSLLRTMVIRQGMQKQGITHPNKIIIDATEVLVQKLKDLDEDEEIEIVELTREEMLSTTFKDFKSIIAVQWAKYNREI